MSTSPPSARRRYVLAGGLVVVSVVLGIVFAVTVARAVAGYTIEPVAQPAGSTVTVGDRSLAVWASPAEAYPSCEAENTSTGRDSFSERPGSSMTVTRGTRSWERVGLVEGAPGSTHTLTCSAGSEVTIGTADNPRIVRYVVLGVVLGGSAVLLLLAAFVLALVTALRKPKTTV